MYPLHESILHGVVTNTQEDSQVILLGEVRIPKVNSRRVGEKIQTEHRQDLV